MVAFALVAVVLRPATDALAGPAEDAEVHIKKGIELRRAENAQGALVEFKAAYAIHKSPRSAAQLSLCEQALGRWADAEGHMIEALAGKDDPWIKKNRDVLEGALAKTKTRVGRVEISGSPDGAQVSAAGVLVGTLPMNAPVAFNTGALELQFKAPGYRAVTRSLTVKAGDAQQFVIHLERLPVVTSPAVKPDVAALAPAPAPQEGPTTISGSADTAPDADRPLYARPWVWVTAGVVIAGAVVAVALASGGTTFPASNGTLEVAGE